MHRKFHWNTHVAQWTNHHHVLRGLASVLDVFVCPLFRRGRVDSPVLDVELVIVGEDLERLMVNNGHVGYEA